MTSLQLFHRRHMPGGANVPHFKNTTECATALLPTPSKVCIPMQQHIGAPCEPVVKVGETVKAGQLIGDSPSPVSAPIHASISGKVTAIDEILMPFGAKCTSVTITSDGENTVDETLQPPEIKDREDFLNAIRASGLVGLGGAGFPTSVKLNPKNIQEVNTLIINGAECEPFITSDYREFMENADDVIEGILLVQKFLEMKEVYIGIENNKPEAIKLMTKKLANYPEINVVTLKSRYPQGAEKVLIYEVSGKVVPEGKLPADVGVLVMNVASIGFLNRYCKTGIPLISKRLTIDGAAISHHKNIRVPIGTMISDVAEYCGGYSQPVKKILMGGPMMGTALYTDDFPILKQNNAILFLGEENLPKHNHQTACIRCGRCVRACPMSLMPLEVERAYKQNDISALQSLKVGICMECGSCEYSCPAKRPLVSTMRLSKQAVRTAIPK